ncbi:MarR family transcriptional regulator [Nonomuraea sp. NPDC000554]|uniref:GbsR/MarR family transcriptional regulator n=1 Tax=Nonomuraea sp. NPDC000554 TaxID=3154259 RepID=UPI003320F48D
MPGGRLTYEDRQSIAAGLAERLGYAEIARRLGRPTSTISREVARNGGPGGYRADRAHQATEGRARRRRRAPSPAPQVATGGYGRDPEAVRDLEEGLTALLVQTGVPRTTARVLTCLYTTDSGSLTAAELVQRLRVSPASISMAVGYLEEQALLRRERDPGRRRERYVIDDDVWYRAFLASAQMTVMLADAARGGADVLGAATPAGARLGDMGRFLGYLGDDMVQTAERWWQIFVAHRTAGRRYGGAGDPCHVTDVTRVTDGT